MQPSTVSHSISPPLSPRGCTHCPHTPYWISRLPEASSILRIRWFFSHWNQTKPFSAVYVLGNSYLLVYASWLMALCLREISGGPGFLRLFPMSSSSYSASSSLFPTQPQGFTGFCPLIGCIFVSVSCLFCLSRRAAMLGSRLQVHHNISSSFRPWSFSWTWIPFGLVNAPPLLQSPVPLVPLDRDDFG